MAVAAVDAGGEVPCGCGRRVPVPRLSELRSAAGEGTAAPELVVRAALADGTLPAEADCVGCGAAGAPVGHVVVNISRAGGGTAGRLMWVSLLTLKLELILFFLFVRFVPPGRSGEGVFRLPVRACAACAKQHRPRDLLARTPVYARVLDKHPHARVGRFKPA